MCASECPEAHHEFRINRRQASLSILNVFEIAESDVTVAFELRSLKRYHGL